MLLSSRAPANCHSALVTMPQRSTPSYNAPQVFNRSDTASVANLSIPHLRQALHILESEMACLLTKRDEIESHLEQAVRLQTPSPIHRLPCELLASIFIMGVLHAEEEDSLMLSALMLVCHYWHDVAVNAPFLWSKIILGNHHSLEKARRKLSRSKSVPLDICIDFNARFEHDGVITENIVHAIDLLVPDVWRWKYFYLSVPNRHQAYAALSRCRGEASLLEVFSVRIFHSMQEDHYANPPLPLFDGSTPRLRSCSFTSFHFGWDTTLVRNLRVLKLDGYWNGFAPSASVLLDILQACPGMEELGLRNMSDIVESRSVPDLVQLPQLTKASFYYSGFSRTQSILARLSFPALRSIEICYLDDINPLLDLLHRQSLVSLPLRCLRIESGFFNELKLIKLLHRLPTLTTLKLVDVEDASSNFLKVLSAPPVSQLWVCPNLRTLSLEGCTTDWDHLRTLVESRLPAQARAFPRQLPSLPSAQDQSKFAMASVYPERLESLDLTRSHISKEMLQWLRMYVSEVKCDTSRGVWGDPCS